MIFGWTIPNEIWRRLQLRSIWLIICVFRSGDSVVLPGASSSAVGGASPSDSLRLQAAVLQRSTTTAQNHQTVRHTLTACFIRALQQCVCVCVVNLHVLRCPPVAVTLARKRMAGERVESCDALEFDVVELADTMGWQLPLVKRGLRQLQWGSGERTHSGTNWWIWPRIYLTLIVMKKSLWQ